MKISVITPVYNSEKYLDKLLESVLMQTYKNYEVILVDDGSTDNSLKIIKNYAKKNASIKYISIKNSGPGVARRKGFELSTGDLLFFMDSDDWMPNNKVFQKIIDIYEKEKFDILLFDVKVKKNNEEIIDTPFEGKKMKSGKWQINYLYNKRITPALWYKVFLKKKMKKEYFCDYRNFEDFYTTYLYLSECENFYYIKEILYYSDRDNQNSMSNNLDEKKLSDTIDLLKEIYNKSNPKFKFIISEMMAVFYITLRRMIDKSNNSEDKKSKRIKKARELKKYFNIWKIIKMKMSYREYAKYFYYEIVDKII